MLQNVKCSFVVRNFGKIGQQMWKVRFQSSTPQGEDDVISSTCIEQTFVHLIVVAVNISCPELYPNPTECREDSQNVGDSVEKNAALTAPVFMKLAPTFSH